MSASVFGPEYADQYDLLYGDKNYEAECDLIEEVFHRYGQGNIHSILDLGCGTGSHAILLARRGYQVTGVDLSADMLAHAREKAANLQSTEDKMLPVFTQGDVRNIDLRQQFDAVLMMFAVLGYQLANKDVLAALQTVRRHLKPGGVFVFDIWYGPAVLNIRPSERMKIIPITNGQLIRFAAGELDTFRHWCTIRYHLWAIAEGKLIDETLEEHQMRFFFPQELRMALQLIGLELVSLTAFAALDVPADESSWNALGVASALPAGNPSD